MGGENVFQVIRIWPRSGSSPRGRGKRERDPARRRAMGLIPAWAGKTKGGTTLHQGSWAHPRVGGENALLICRLKSATGSSPRGRGKLQDFAARLQATGLIPAWAGKTAGVPWYADGRRAHPRVGGENLSSGWHPLKGPGSSPRGRGKLTRGCVRYNPYGLIPAWAGKTSHK